MKVHERIGANKHTIQRILHRLGGPEPFQPQQNGRPARRALSPQELLKLRRSTAKRAREASRGGMLVFVSRRTKQQLSTLFGEPMTSALLRRIVEKIATGTIRLDASPRVSPTGLLKRTTPAEAPKPPTPQQPIPKDAVTLKEAARLLNVKDTALYYRCTTNRVQYIRDGWQYFIPKQEVERLKVAGLG